MRYLALLLMLPLLFSFGCTKKTLAGKLEGKWISTPDISRMYNAGYTILEIKGSGYLEYTIKDCHLYTSPSTRDGLLYRKKSSA